MNEQNHTNNVVSANATADRINKLYVQATSKSKEALKLYVELGRQLLALKETMPGTWVKWRKANLEISGTQIDRYIEAHLHCGLIEEHEFTSLSELLNEVERLKQSPDSPRAECDDSDSLKSSNQSKEVQPAEKKEPATPKHQKESQSVKNKPEKSKEGSTKFVEERSIPEEQEPDEVQEVLLSLHEEVGQLLVGYVGEPEYETVESIIQLVRQTIEGKYR